MTGTVHELFFAAVLEHGARPFLRRTGSAPLSYLDARRAVAATMVRLAGLGIRRGDFVVSYLEETIPIALFDLACASLGVVPVPLSHHFSTASLRDLVASVDAKAILTTPQLVASVEALGPPVLAFDGDAAHVLELRPPLSDADVEGIVSTLPVAVTERDPFMVQPTSGSTGTPKLVVRTHAAFSRYARFVGRQLAEDNARPPIVLSVQALTHAFGLHMFTTAMSLGATVVIPTELDTNASLADIWTLEPSVLPMVPRVLRSFYRQHMRALVDAPSRRMFPPTAHFVVVAGGKGDPEILELCASQGAAPIEFYGSSEASLIALTPRGEWRPGWAGRVVADATVRLAPDGEVLVRSPGLMLGYHGAEDLTRNVFTEDGFYRTSDLGELSTDGYLKIFGRKLDAFNTPEGSLVYPERIESELERLPWAHQVMLIGDERPFITAYIVVSDDCVLDSAADGFLDDVAHRGLYARAAASLSVINEGLERHEKIAVFSLFARPFEAAVYRSVGQGKVRRDRRRFQEHYEARIARVYASSFDFANSAQRLTKDRRFRPHVEVHHAVSRGHSRHSVNVRIYAESADARWTTETINLSLGGALLAAGPTQLGAYITLRFPDSDLQLVGEVVRLGPEGCSVRFRGMTPELRTQLGALLPPKAGFDA